MTIAPVPPFVSDDVARTTSFRGRVLVAVIGLALGLVATMAWQATTAAADTGWSGIVTGEQTTDSRCGEGPFPGNSQCHVEAQIEAQLDGSLSLGWSGGHLTYHRNVLNTTPVGGAYGCEYEGGVTTQTASLESAYGSHLLSLEEPGDGTYQIERFASEPPPHVKYTTIQSGCGKGTQETTSEGGVDSLFGICLEYEFHTFAYTPQPLTDPLTRIGEEQCTFPLGGEQAGEEETRTLAWNLKRLPPTVTKVAPAKGPADGGTTVKISGTTLTGATAVKFGGTDAASFEVITKKGVTTITATSPAHAVETVDVTVTNNKVASALSTKDRFKFLPAVTNVSPNTGSKAGGTSVTITGAGFALGKTATKLKFGTTLSKSVNCTSTTECTAVAPAHAIGTVDVKATVNKLSSAKNAPADQFTYN
jgi:hypothetical protein